MKTFLKILLIFIAPASLTILITKVFDLTACQSLPLGLVIGIFFGITAGKFIK